MRKPEIKGLAGIDKGIKALKGVGENLNERVQDIAVAIIEHAAGPGNGDISRALILCQAVKSLRTLNVAYLVGFLRHFGRSKVDLNAGKVTLIKPDTRGFRDFDVDGARANKWYDAVDPKTGEKAPWYAGPLPPEFTPYTIGDLAERMQRFVKQTGELIDPENTKTVNGKEVPVYNLAEGDREQVNNALLFINRIANTLARHEDLETLAKEMADTQDAIEADKEVVAIMQPPKEKMVA